MSSYDNQNIFAKILRGEIPCIKVYEDEHCLSFMDIMPQTDGHTLVIPKAEAVTLFDLDGEQLKHLMQTVQKVGLAVQKAMGIEGCSTFQHNGKAAGQSVDHIHFHVIPGSLMGLKGHAGQMGDMEQIQAIAEKIKQYL